MRSRENNKPGFVSKIIVIAFLLICVCLIINLAPNYIQSKFVGKIQLIINNGNVTGSLKKKIIVDDNDVIYLSFEDIENFFDGEIYFDKENNQIITTSDTKVATLPLEKKQIVINGSKTTIYGVTNEKDGTYYIPFSELKDVYNVDVSYSEKTKIVTIDSLNKEQKKGNCSKNTSIKYKKTNISKTVAKTQKGESVVVISEEDGWYKVRTSNGNIGYTKNVTNIYNVRENLENKEQVSGKISLVWDYYSEYVKAPVRTEKIKGVNVVFPSFASLVKSGQGELFTNIGDNGKQYVEWAHKNGYKVWPMVSNNSYKDTTSEILNSYELRQKLINSMVEMAVSSNVDGINLDFENIKQADKEMFTRFVIELAPRLREFGKVLSVDVTAPDGSEDWSMCYDRNKIAKVADYIVFMAYDQNGISSPKEGTTAGADWVEVNIKKFLGQEGVDANKIILGMPFYTRLWKNVNGNTTSSVIEMQNINSSIPSNVNKVWDDDLKQYVVDYQLNGATYKMWIEDEESIKAKFELMNKYELAGAAYWRKGFEPNTIWNIVENQINK